MSNASDKMTQVAPTTSTGESSPSMMNLVDTTETTGAAGQTRSALDAAALYAAVQQLNDEPKPELSNASIHGSRSVIGLDVGTRTLKIVHLQTSGTGIRLVDAQTVDLPPKSDPERLEFVASSVRAFLAQAKPRVRAACCALSGEGVATVCCSMPKMGDSDLAEALRWKVADAASVEASDCIVGHYVLDSKSAGGNVDVVAAAVPHNVGQVDQLFDSDTPRLSVVISEPIAAENIVMAAYHAQEHGPVAVLDIGTTTCRLSVVGEKGLEFTREVPVGSDTITAALAGKVTLENETIDVSRATADQLKRLYTIGSSKSVTAMGVTLPGGRILASIRPVLERIGSEVVRSLQFYAQGHGLRKVDALFITGGGAALGGLPEYLSKETHITTARMDPWRMLGFDIAPDVAVEPALFAVATGAAIHNSSRINLVPAHIKARRTVHAIRAGSFIVSSCVILALAGLSWKANQNKAELERTLRVKQNATQPMEEAAVRIEVAKTFEAELARRKAILSSLGVGRPMHAAIFKELSNIMPEGTYLRSLSFSKSEGVRRVSLSVDVYSMQTVSSLRLKQQLIAALEDSPFFVNVSFRPTRGREQSAVRRPDEALELTCQVLGFPGE